MASNAVLLLAAMNNWMVVNVITAALMRGNGEKMTAKAFMTLTPSEVNAATHQHVLILTNDLGDFWELHFLF